MSISKPCPRCQEPMEIPQPVPEKIQCGKCGVVVKFAKSPAPAPAAVTVPPAVEKEPAKPVKPTPAPKAAKESPPDEAPKPKPKKAGGLVSYLHTVIPKPILFGFYGGLGGLLGVLLFGELLWLALHPTPVTLEPIKIMAPAEVTVFPGSENKFTVKVQRLEGYEGPIRLEGTGTWDIEIPEVIVPADKDEAEIFVKAKDGAEEGLKKVKLHASFDKNDKIKVTEEIKVLVDPTPPTLQVSVPDVVTVYAGGQNKFGFVVARRLFEGPVRVEVMDLPKGITIPMVVLPENVTKGEFSVVTTKEVMGDAFGTNAKMIPHLLPIEVRSLRNHTINNKNNKVQLNIEPPPGKLQLAASPQVTVYPGTKNRFVVKIARGDFKAPVAIEVTGQPRGVIFSKATIDEDKSEAEIEVSAPDAEKLAENGTLVGGPPYKGLRVTAKALLAEDITMSVPQQLIILPVPPTVQLAVSPKVQVYPGGKSTFGVKIARQRFPGAVQISLQGPGYLSGPPVTIPADQTTAQVEVSASSAALGLGLPVIAPTTITARSQDGRAVTTEPMQVEVLAPPSDLQMTVSPEVDVYQAGRCKFTIKIARSGFVGPVRITFDNVPTGVTLTPATINANDLILNGSATLDAEPKRYVIDVVGTGPKAPDGKVPTATRKFGLTVKTFDPSLRPPLDVVFVLDVTTSMDEPILGVRNGIDQFVRALKDRDLDARVGLIAFRDINFDKPPNPVFEILEFNKSPFTTDTKAFSAEVGKLKAVGGGDLPESSLDAIVQAADYPFRPNALKILLLITDDEPQTLGNSVKMPTAVKHLLAKKINQVHLIVPKKHLPKYVDLHTVTKGGVFDFDEIAKKKKGSFTGLLPLLSREIVTTIGAPEPVALVPQPPDSAPPPPNLTGEKTPEPRAEASPASPRPEVPLPPRAGEASVIKAADPQAPAAEKVLPPAPEAAKISGVQSNQQYADKDRLQLLLAVALWTAMLAGGIALTLVAAQKRYLSQSWLSIAEIVKALGFGMIAGLLAGVIGQWVFQTISSFGAWNALSLKLGWDIIGGVGRLLGWMILGGMIGGGMGFFIPNLNWKRAIIGGSIGGLLGAVGFELVSHYTSAILGRWIGAALLGFCIGVMVALAELAFRRYWLEVATGREIRTVTLGASPVSLGGDEKLVGVLVPNAIPRALGYRVDRHRVICEDFATGKTADAPPGDERLLEGVRIRVCSAASAQATGASLQLIVTREVALMEGMPLTADDIPGLDPQGNDGVVALVNRRPNNPKVFVLRNRSKQSWQVTDADGSQRKVDPGLGIDLSNRSEVDFGQVKAILDPGEGTAELKKSDTRVKAE